MEKSVSYICEEYYFLDFQLVFRNNCFNIIIHQLVCSGYPPRGKQNKTMITKVQGGNIFCAERQACSQVGKPLQRIHGCSEMCITNWLHHKSSVVVSCLREGVIASLDSLANRRNSCFSSLCQWKCHRQMVTHLQS